MNRWTIQIDKKARAELLKIDKPLRLKLVELIDSLEYGNPRTKGKPLTGNKSGLWRYRVADYRVVCRIEDTALIIVLIKVAHRSKVYD